MTVTLPLSALVRAGFIAFEPLDDTPGSFCWTRVDSDHVNVSQRWTDGDGRTRSHVISLERVQ